MKKIIIGYVSMFCFACGSDEIPANNRTTNNQTTTNNETTTGNKCALLPVGAECAHSSECESGHFCDGLDPGPFYCAVSNLKLNEDCNALESCESPNVCDLRLTTPNKCIPRIALGEDCADTQECEKGLYCKGQDAGPFSCVVSTLKFGESCTNFDSCEAPNICDLSVAAPKCGPPRTCLFEDLR